MFKFIKELFAIEKTPRRGLFALEWVVLGYMIFTLLIVLFAYTKVANPDAMIWGRVRIGAMTVALWAVYRMVPCRFTRFARVFAQMALLAWWYPDTYEINRMFPNLDHVFASWEQSLFGCQPALLFSKEITSHVFSELMDLGYASYFPMIVVTVLFYFGFRYDEFERASFIVIASFFAYYIIFVLLPVTGPQYYYGAAGMDNIAHGIFPNVHDYFNSHQERLVSPGYTDGVFYHLVVDAHNAGERPTAAFPSSHVGISTVILLLAWHSRSRKLFFLLLPFFILMCFSTVYIQAHYAIDAIAGLITGAAFYFSLLHITKHWEGSGDI
jgi:membrane-associated phospholipid phosphatase